MTQALVSQVAKEPYRSTKAHPLKGQLYLNQRKVSNSSNADWNRLTWNKAD